MDRYDRGIFPAGKYENLIYRNDAGTGTQPGVLIACKFGTLGKYYDLNESEIRKIIKNKPSRPQDNHYYMDHAFFSAVRLFQQLVTILGAGHSTRAHLGALTAIMMHNSLYKFAIDP